MKAELKIDSISGTLRDQYISKISMLITLISFTMMFATLFLGYAIYRITAETWPPMGMVNPSLGLPSLSTFVIALSSISFWRFEKSYSVGKLDYKWLCLTGVLGVLFLVTQSLLWTSLHSLGLYASSGIFGSIIFGFTWIHAAHIFLALALLVWLSFRIKYKKAILPTVQNVGKFWHLLGVVWLIMFVTIFAI